MKRRVLALIAFLMILCLFTGPVRADVEENVSSETAEQTTVSEKADEEVTDAADVAEESGKSEESAQEETAEAETAADIAAEEETAEVETAADIAANEATLNGDQLVWQELTYQITNDSEKTVVLTGTAGQSAPESLVIPESIPYNGSDYKVTGVGAGAFAGDPALTSLTVAASVELIEAEAFSNCLKLSEITFAEGSNLKQICVNAFAYLGKDSGTVPATISKLTLPASLETIEDGAFHCIPVEYFALEDGSMLKEIPCGFLAADGKDGYPGEETESKGFFDFIHYILFEYVSFTPEKVAAACDCLKSVDFGDNNHLKLIGMGAFKNQTHLTSIDFGKKPAAEELVICNGVFVAAGNSGAGIDTLVFPSNLSKLGEGTPNEYNSGYKEDALSDSGSFNYANIKNLVFSDGCLLEVIPEGFMEVTGTGSNAHPGESYDYNNNVRIFDYDRAQAAANSLETIRFGKNNHIKRIEDGAFKNQSHLTSIDFGTSSVDLTIDLGAFIGAGNNGYLVEQGADTKLNAGIETLTLPANLVTMKQGAFNDAKVKNLVLEDNCRLQAIPNHFLGLSGEGCNGHPGMHHDYSTNVDSFRGDLAQRESNSLETVSFGKNNRLTEIGYGAFYNQSHLTSIDFGTSTAETLLIRDGAFIGAGNNGYLVENGIDETLNEGIETLVFPANVTFSYSYTYNGRSYSAACYGMFEYAKIKNLVFSDNGKTSEIPSGFMGVHLRGNNGYPGMDRNFDTGETFFVKDLAQICANSLETVKFGANNSFTSFGHGCFFNQSHLKVIDFGSSSVESVKMEDGAFIGVGNNGYLVDQKIDETLNKGIETLVFPANLTYMGYGCFDYSCVKNVVFSDNCKLTQIQSGFLGVAGIGNNGHPGQDSDGLFVPDQAQLMANSLKTIRLGENNSLTYIGNGAFRNQGHVTMIDFGTSDAELTISWGAFIGIGNNAYLVESGAEDTLNKGIDTLTLPANLKELRNGAFGFAGIRNLVLSDGIGISALESGSFQDLDLMKKLVLGADFTITRLDGGAFSKCDELKTIDLRDSGITGIDDAIKENAKLTSIIFPEKLESITWTYDSSLPEEYTAGVCPFYGCGNVNELTFTNVDPSGLSFDTGVFQFLNEAGTVYVPAETTDEQVEAYRAKLTGAGLNIDEKDHWKLRRIGLKATRVFGSTRYKTSIAVAEELKELLGVVKFDTIFIATGENPVDALAGSYLSVNMKAPILMIQNKKTPIKLVTDFVKENLAEDGTVYVFGGENAVPEACLAGLKDFDVQRIAGSTRWRTNIMINEILGVPEGEEVLICDGIGEKDENGVEQYAYADSLSASASGKPILLVDGSASSLKNYQKAYLKKLAENGCRFTILGGEKAVSAEMKVEIESITGTTAERLYGSTRYRTSAALAQRYFANAKKMVLASGENFPDGLCGGVLANVLGGPVFLVKGTTVPVSLAKDFAQGNGVLEAIVLGGDKAITDSTVREVFSLGAEEEIIVHQVK